VLGATTCSALGPLPSNTLFAVSVVAPVPPLATGNVPEAEAIGTFVIVLFEPLIVLFVKVSVLLAVMMLVGVMMLDRVAIVIPC
jgi:hypothetical protein